MMSTLVARCLIFAALLSIAASFTPPQFVSIRNRVACRPQFAAASDDHEFTTEEVTAMDELIISLTLEPTDESRRTRVTTLFTEELAKPNGAPQRFTDIFDAVLMVVGDRVQTEARQRALEAAEEEQEEPEEEPNEEPNEEPEKDDEEQVVKPKATFMERSPDERQMWALVDLMVQTKTLVKKANGKLGTGGAFN
jgi:hypothetical protein